MSQVTLSQGNQNVLSQIQDLIMQGDYNEQLAGGVGGLETNEGGYLPTVNTVLYPRSVHTAFLNPIF